MTDYLNTEEDSIRIDYLVEENIVGYIIEFSKYRNTRIKYKLNLSLDDALLFGYILNSIQVEYPKLDDFFGSISDICYKQSYKIKLEKDIIKSWACYSNEKLLGYNIEIYKKDYPEYCYCFTLNIENCLLLAYKLSKHIFINRHELSIHETTT